MECSIYLVRRNAIHSCLSDISQDVVHDSEDSLKRRFSEFGRGRLAPPRMSYRMLDSLST
jgi:hypothetical protein